MTEEEAKTKRCCGPSGCGFTTGAENHIAYHDGSTGELMAAVVPIRWCIGSACMGWRRLPRPEYDPDVQLQYHGSSLKDIERMKLSAGFCGLAGKP